MDDLIDEFDSEQISYPVVPTAASSSSSSSVSKNPSSTPVSYPSLSNGQTSSASSSVLSLETTRKWKDVLVLAGIPVEFAWKYGLCLANHGFGEANAHTLTHAILARLNVGKTAKEQADILSTIAKLVHEADKEKEEEEEHDVVERHDAGRHVHKDALLAWRGLFNRTTSLGWDTRTKYKYASLLSEQNWDAHTMENLTEDMLLKAGIANPNHREVILELVEREIAEADLNPAAAFDNNNNADEWTEEDKQESERVRAELSQKIEAFQVFQDRLALILRGDTDKQREAKKRREEEREARRRHRQLVRQKKHL